MVLASATRVKIHHNGDIINRNAMRNGRWPYGMWSFVLEEGFDLALRIG